MKESLLRRSWINFKK